MAAATEQDRCFAVFRNVSRDDQLSVLDRLRLLEVIELRSMGWKGDRDVSEYYACKYKKLNAGSAENNHALLEQQACASHQARQNERRPQMGTDKPEKMTAAPSAGGTTVDLGGQLKTPPAVADGETEQWVRGVTVGTEVAYISGMSEAVVNMITSAVQTLYPNVTADTLRRTNQTLTCMPPNPASTLTREAVARPLADIQRLGDALDTPSAQDTSDTSGITNGSESNRFKTLESRTECSSTDRHQMLPTDLNTRCNGGSHNLIKGFDGLGGAVQFSSGYSGHGFNTLDTASEKPDQAKCFDGFLSPVQYSGSVDNEHVPTSAFRTPGTSSEPGQLNHFKGLGNPALFSSGDNGQLLSSDFNALGSTGARSLERQFGGPTGLKQPSGNTENQKVEPSGDFKGLVRSDRTDKNEQPFDLPSSAHPFSSANEQGLHTKALGNIDVPGQLVQFKGEIQAQYSSKTDGDNQRRLSATFTSPGTRGQSRTEQYERLGPSAEFSRTTENQAVPFGNKSMGSTDGTSHANQYEMHGSSTQFSSNAAEHVQHTGFQTSSVGGLPVEKQQPGMLASSEELRSADDNQVIRSDSPEAAGPPCPDRKVYTREFLLECLYSPLAFEIPPDFPHLDPHVAWAMVRKDRYEYMC
ncbi:hypothetical protein MTO96_029840 [Rhipicephalus appendiculatus]